MQSVKLKDLKKRRVSTLVNGERWVLEVITSEKYKDLETSDLDIHTEQGCCYRDGRNRIYFNGEVSCRTVIHELWHAYKMYFFLNSTSDVSPDDIEEIEAEFLELGLFSFTKQVDRIYRQLVGDKVAEKEITDLTERKRLK